MSRTEYALSSRAGSQIQSRERDSVYPKTKHSNHYAVPWWFKKCHIIQARSLSTSLIMLSPSTGLSRTFLLSPTTEIVSL